LAVRPVNLYGKQVIRRDLCSGPRFLGFAGQNQQIRVRFSRQRLEYTAVLLSLTNSQTALVEAAGVLEPRGSGQFFLEPLPLYAV
jgi:hypothetical protein